MNARRIAAIALVAGCSFAGCLRLDVFAFRPRPVDDKSADLMAKSAVPLALREEIASAIVSPDGTVVNAYVVKHAANDGTPVERHGRGILYCHGNNTNIQVAVPRIDALWKLGYTVLIFDARGFGKTEGTQTEAGVFSDARAAFDYFVKRDDLGLDGARVGLYGRSLGSALCLDVATQRAAPALALESPISSLQRIIDDSTGLDTPVGWYVDAELDNPSAAAAYEGALFVMHGLEDDYVQPKYGQALYDGATKAKSRELWLVPGADHGNLPCASFEKVEVEHDCAGGTSTEWEQRVTTFFDRTLGG